MRIPESELIINADGSAFHIHILPHQLADNVILVGDPGRVEMVKSFFSSIEYEGASREFVWATGLYNSKRFTVLSTGIGTDNCDIVMTELDALANIDFVTREPNREHRKLTIVRIGTCGAIQSDVPLGAFITSEISIGCDGLLNWYADRDSISLADYEQAFKKHAKWNSHLADPYFVKASERLVDLFRDCTYVGMTISAPGFYGPQGRQVRLGLAMPDMIEDFESFSYDGHRITNFEMEGSAIAGLSAHLGHDAVTICCALAHRHHKAVNIDYKPLVRNLVGLVLDKLSAN